VRADIIIDDFSTTQSLTISAGGTSPVTVQSQAGGSGIVGGFRDMILTRTFGDDQSSTQAFFSTINGANILTFRNALGVKATLDLQYDANDWAGLGDPTYSSIVTYVSNGITAFDATQGDTLLGVAFHAASDDGGTTSVAPTVTVRLSSGLATYSSTVTLIETASPGLPVFNYYFIPFAAFGISNAQLHSVTGVDFYIDASQDHSQDIQFRLVGFTTPAPSGVVLAGMAMAIGLAYAWRRHRTTNAVAAI
jgi:hypothetical protein